MGVIPGGSNPVPEGGQSAADMAALQLVTEDSVRSQVSGKALAPWASAHGSFFGTIIGGIGSALAAGIAGIGNTVGSWAASFFESGTAVKQVRDGQADLNDRTDLLGSLLDYGAVSTQPGGGDAMKGTGRIPFSYQIGAKKGVRIADNCIILDDIGVWDLRGQITASWTANVFNPELKVWLRVLRPDGSIYSQQAHYASTTNSITIPIVTCVMVKEPGYKVDMWAQADGSRGWWRGPEWTRLIVQHITRDISEGGTGGETSAEEIPNPPVEDESEEG